MKPSSAITRRVCRSDPVDSARSGMVCTSSYTRRAPRCGRDSKRDPTAGTIGTFICANAFNAQVHIMYFYAQTLVPGWAKGAKQLKRRANYPRRFAMRIFPSEGWVPLSSVGTRTTCGRIASNHMGASNERVAVFPNFAMTSSTASIARSIVTP